MSNFTVVFVHTGNPAFLGFAVAQAAVSGHSVVVVGDDQCIDGLRTADLPCQFLPIADFWQTAADFASIYEHASLNDYHWEMFCFQRWFVLRGVMEMLQTDVVFADSDVLLFPGFDDGFLKPVLGSAGMFNSAWFNYIKSVEALRDFTVYMFDLFSSPGRIAELGALHQLDGRPQVSDMTVLENYARSFSGRCADVVRYGEFLGLDGNLAGSQIYEVVDGFKRVVFDKGCPYVFRRDGGFNRFYTLHFQGKSKCLMQILNSIGAEQLGRLADLGYYLREDERCCRADPSVSRRFRQGKTLGSARFTEEHPFDRL